MALKAIHKSAQMLLGQLEQVLGSSGVYIDPRNDSRNAATARTPLERVPPPNVGYFCVLVV